MQLAKALDKIQSVSFAKFKVLKIWLLSSCLLNSAAILAAKSDWTWSFGKKLTTEQAARFADQSEIIFAKPNLPEFTQLIFSWNAHRPTQGYFRFWVQCYHPAKQRWTEWHKMVDWGHMIQRSHRVQHQPEYAYEFVRFEAGPRQVFTGFRVKVSAHNGANLANLRHLGVCISNFNHFKAESVQKLMRLPSVKVMNVPTYSQMVQPMIDRAKICSPTALSMQVAYLAGMALEVPNFARQVYDFGLEAYGSWPLNTAHAFERHPHAVFRVVRLRRFADLYVYLRANLPVVVSIRGPIRGGATPYAGGHLVLVTGWDRQRKIVFCHDPAMSSNHKVPHKYRAQDFLTAWEKSKRLAYVAEPR